MQRRFGVPEPIVAAALSMLLVADPVLFLLVFEETYFDVSSIRSVALLPRQSVFSWQPVTSESKDI